MNENVIVEKSKALALRIIKLNRYLRDDKHETVIAKQILRSGTSIGANVREAVRAQSRADFLTKLTISLKEAEETAYWLELLYESDYIEEKAFKSIYSDVEEVIRILVSITKNTKTEK